MAKVSVIVPAAGSGERFGGKGNKIFERIKGRPVFVRTLEAFANRDDVCEVHLVIAPADREEMIRRFSAHLGFMNVNLVDGGPTRPESVRNALAGVSDAAELVCVHDAVRPCVSQLWIDAVFAKAEQTGAALLAYPLHGTLKRVAADDVVEETLNRSGLWEAQTPQVFRKDVLAKAYAGEIDGATDDAQLVEATGHPVSVVLGDPRNVKITTPCDLALAGAVIDLLPKPKDRGFSHPFHEGR